MLCRFETDYSRNALTVMAKCLRKTVRRKRSRKSHAWGWIVEAMALFLLVLSCRDGEGLNVGTTVTAIMAVLLPVVLIFEDRINGAIAGRGLLKGTEHAVAVFDSENPDFFVSETAVGKTEFPYESVLAIAETEAYFVFILSAIHGQIYDKRSLSEEDVDAFRQFIRERTGKEIVPVK